MDIQIKTKFNLGQEVYTYSRCNHFDKGEYVTHFIPRYDPLVITQIIIYTSAQGSNINYHLFDDRVNYHHSEDSLFNTLEEVQEWCNEQNKLYE